MGILRFKPAYCKRVYMGDFKTSISNASQLIVQFYTLYFDI